MFGKHSHRWAGLVFVGCAARAVAPAPPVVSPPTHPAFAAWEARSPADRRSTLMTVGAHVYETGGTSGIPCRVCHMAKGEGVIGVFPPLAGSGAAMGDCAATVGILLRGQSGLIEVQGVAYNGVMPPMDTLTDGEVAAVVTYVRNSWGNDLGVCDLGDVAAVRAAIGPPAPVAPPRVVIEPGPRIEGPEGGITVFPNRVVEVWVDGALVGRGTVSVRLPPGTHEIEARLPWHPEATASFPVAVRAAEAQRITLEY